MKKSLLVVLALNLQMVGIAQWNYISPGASGLLLQQKVTFQSATVGFMVGTNAVPNGNARIAKTTNGGVSWSTVYSLPPALTPSTLTMNDIQVVDANVAYAVGGYAIDEVRGVIAKSTNGGTTWDTLTHTLPTSKFLALHFFNANNGLIGGFGLYSTANGGTSWTEVTLPSGVVDISDIHFVDANTGFAVSNTGGSLIRSTNGGATWSEVTLPTSEETKKLVFFDASRGLIACDNGVILYTSNGGLNWSAATNADPDLDDVLCVEMVSATVGYAGTVGGRILHTTNGGQTWTVGVDATTLSAALLFASIYDIDFVNQQAGYACGSLFGGILKTTNGGVVGIEEWTRETLAMAPNPATDHLRYDGQDMRTVQVHSADGRLIETHTNTTLNGNLPVAHLPAGAYVLRAFGRDVVREGLFIKD